MRYNKKKGQEEVVGFVLIVVIIAVAFVIFLGIRLRNPEPVQKQSEILYQFIESSMEQTTDCVLRENGKNTKMRDLIKECNSFDSLCLNEKTSCQTVNETMNLMLDSSWKVGPDYPYKGYELIADYQTNSTSGSDNEKVLEIAQGTCLSNYISNSYLLPDFPGNIVVKVKICS